MTNVQSYCYKNYVTQFVLNSNFNWSGEEGWKKKFFYTDVPLNFIGFTERNIKLTCRDNIYDLMHSQVCIRG